MTEALVASHSHIYSHSSEAVDDDPAGLFLAFLPLRLRLLPLWAPRARLAAMRSLAKGTNLTSWLAPILWRPGNPATLIEIFPLMILTLLRRPASPLPVAAVRRRRRRRIFLTPLRCFRLCEVCPPHLFRRLAGGMDFLLAAA